MLGFFVLIGLLAFAVGWYFNSYSITLIALFFAAGYAFWSYYAADKLALSMNNAKQIQKSDAPDLWRIVENLAITTGLPMPKVYIINDPALNAFATGRDPKHATVTVTTGLLETMNKQELQGVIAHELGHIQNYDIRVMMIAFGLVAAVSIISDTVLRMMFWSNDDEGNNNPIAMIVAIVAVILAPLVATMIQLSVSRKREFLADATGALTTRYPEGLASALIKIRNNAQPMQKQSPSTAHLFFANPLSSKSFNSLFSTHPPIEDRIKALQTMESKT